MFITAPIFSNNMKSNHQLNTLTNLFKSLIQSTLGYVGYLD
jgi:hypothetical protein